MFGQNSGPAPPSWHANFQKSRDEEYGRIRYRCNHCLNSFSVTGARKHAESNCIGAAQLQPQLDDQNLLNSPRPIKKGRTRSNDDTSVTASDRHDKSGSPHEAGSGDTAAGAVATIVRARGNLNDPQLFQTGDADDFFESTFDSEAVPFHQGGACEAAGNLSLAGNRDMNLQLSDVDGTTGDIWPWGHNSNNDAELDQRPHTRQQDALSSVDIGLAMGAQLQDAGMLLEDQFLAEDKLAEDEKEFLAQFDDLSQFNDDALPDFLCKWEDVADCQVCEDLPGLTVRQAAFSILHTVHTQHTTFKSAQQMISLACFGLLKSKGCPSPTNPNNRFPTSLAVCYKVTGVCEINDFEIHLCPSDANCTQAFRSKVDDPEDHSRRCKGCCDCQCPVCGTYRFVQEKGILRPGFMLYFFHDVLQQMFLDQEWWGLLQKERQSRSSAWLKTNECQDLERWFTDRGVDPGMVRIQFLPPRPCT
jgi:hypothetical protein